ncbi:DUF6695 family protein [Flavobacterium sp. CS20]|jgi:hypothetical protein|uniref:DUF6695 family protein n=1 Tax=Flavobacterium sp. CS20 TaxID=2775246 RepID=UPI001B3A2F7C|nr:DUF6695 family protein [Flavobacterium sp. CS20]QTY27968.1 hypothetical protein IGB25_05575 [Flavobacterium sp. CS20]
MRNYNFINKTLPEPQRPDFLSIHAQWLAGEGAGSWFLLEKTSDNTIYEVTRFSPKGKIECEGFFRLENKTKALNITKPYQFVHLSHCAIVHIKQDKNIFKLVRI